MKRDLFQAIADSTRRAIFSLLATQAFTPGKSAEAFDMTRQAVSKHIELLNACELWEHEKVGRKIYYHLKVHKLKEIDQWLEQFRKFWESRFDRLEQVLSTLKNQENEP